MWFARKPKNRAFERRHVLDVKVARREARRMRARVATMAASLSIGTVFVVYVAWRCGSAALDHFVYKNSAFSIQRIELSTDGVISHEQIRAWAGIKKNDNLFALDLNRVKRDLELVAFVESASVERILPNAIRLSVVEREPVARVQDHLIDRNGFVMMPLESHQRAIPGPSIDHYPAIIGHNRNEVPLGRETESLQVRAALQFLQEFENSAMAAHVDIAKIDVSHPDVLQVTTLQQNEVNYTNKYTPGATEYFCPAPFEKGIIERIQAAAKGAFTAIGARDYARVDVMVRDGEPFVLEVNTLPGMTETSLLPKAAAAAGLSYEQLCQRMIELALDRQGGAKRAA